MPSELEVEDTCRLQKRLNKHKERESKETVARLNEELRSMTEKIERLKEENDSLRGSLQLAMKLIEKLRRGK